MKLKLFLITSLLFTTLNAGWFTNLFTKEELPSYYLNHPQPTSQTIYGVGVGQTYLDAKVVALNDISIQLKSEIKSITSVDKSQKGTQVSENITILTDRKIDNYEIIKEDFIDQKFYLLVEYKKYQ